MLRLIVTDTWRKNCCNAKISLFSSFLTITELSQGCHLWYAMSQGCHLWYAINYDILLSTTPRCFQQVKPLSFWGRLRGITICFCSFYFVILLSLIPSLLPSLPPSLPSASWVSIHSTLHVVCECCVNSFPQMRSGLFAMAIILQSWQSSRRLSSSATTIVHQPFNTTDHMFSQNVMVSHLILTKERVLTCSPCFKQIILK